MAYYSWQVQERNQPQSAELVGLSNRRMSWYLNRPAEVSASIRLADASLDVLQPGRHELVIHRDGVPIGSVLTLTTVDVAASAEETTITAAWRGILSNFQDALVYRGFKRTAQPQSANAWDMIDAFQLRTGGDYGITRGQIPASDPVKSLKLEQDAELLETIVQQSERSFGYDFDIGVDRAFNVYYPQQGSDAGLKLHFPTNVQSVSYSLDAAPGTVASDVRVYGGDAATAIQTAEDATTRSVYGRREQAVQFSGIITSTEALAQHAARAVADRTEPVSIPEVTLNATHPSIPWGSYWLGDTASLEVQLDGFTPLDRRYRIVAIHVDVDQADNEAIRLELNPVA